MKYIKIVFFIFLTLTYTACTKLDEKFRSDVVNASNLTATQLLTSAYNSLNTVQTGDWWHLQEHTSDELIGPTRGPDWDDNGNWRALHLHTWTADQSQVNGAFSALLTGQYNASVVLQPEFKATTQQAAEARFIRAFTIFAVLDSYDQVPYREDLNDFKKLPVTMKSTEAADFVITELNAIISDLPDGPNYIANKDAAKVLLMKVYLNKAVYANRSTPSFDNGDMQQVITLADQIINSGKYSIGAKDYFNNFAPDNDIISKENIFTLLNQPGGTLGGNVRGTWFQIAHYNMNPGGWNGFATLSDFYNKFDATDERRGIDYRYVGALPNPAHEPNVGFFVGQRYDETTGAALKDRQGAPLVFTPEVSIIETGPDLERTGIRVNKYPYDYATNNDQKNNDWAVFRYADVLLMKAEAILRSGGSEAEARNIVNSIRTARGVANFSTLTLANLLDERGRELYWEGWRRQDLIRFGKYLELWQEKPSDDPRNLIFPIPNNQLAVNPNLVQNPGYEQ
ncbi:MAG TPA: RagB/SusD family nutrient uptake outer membrane protein [Parafilimonas sp.]|nr:RagB/SusD family nutrient uptake outer membrane protein [Parafilimonas sp.]